MPRQHALNEAAPAALLSAAAIAAGTTAYGSPVRFENTANFSPNFNALDLTRASDDQPGGFPGSLTGTQIYLYSFADYYPTFSYQRTDTRGNGLEVWNSGFNNFYADALSRGEMIGGSLSGGAWDTGSRLAFSWTSYDRIYIPPTYVYPYGYYGGYYKYTNFMSGERGLLPNNGAPSYIGARLTINGATHYGWIGVTNSFGYIEIFAWGYETEANTAIGAGVPSPSTMGLLALGAAGALKRRRTA